MRARIVLLPLLWLAMSCGAFLGAQGKAQAQGVREVATKVNGANGPGSTSAGAALETLAGGLENGTLGSNNIKAILKVCEDAAADGEVSADEAKAITEAISQNSKAKNPKPQE